MGRGNVLLVGGLDLRQDRFWRLLGKRDVLLLLLGLLLLDDMDFHNLWQLVLVVLEADAGCDDLLSVGSTTFMFDSNSFQLRRHRFRRLHLLALMG